MIKLYDVRKDYVNKEQVTHALRGVTIAIDRGEMIAIMGASGSGKSTLLNVIGGMDRATSGSYLFDGIEVLGIREKELEAFRRKNVSFVFQHFALMEKYSMHENVELSLRARNVRDRKRVVMECLERMGIEELRDKLPGETSGGQQQRCAIARALAADTPLILADEPTGALDRDTGMKIMECFQRLNRERKTILIVTHDPLVAKSCNRIVKIEDGIVMNNGKGG